MTIAIDLTIKINLTGYMKTLEHDQLSRAGSLSLRGGCACLDFVNTASGRGTQQRLEHLQQPEHLVLWSAHARLLPTRQCRRLMLELRGDWSAGKRALRQALQLREAIHAIGQSRALGLPAPRAMLEILSYQYANAFRRAQLVEQAGRIFWKWKACAKPSELLLGNLAQSAVELFSGTGNNRIKKCAGDDCGWLFLDTSRNNSRRWCDMQVCGNRAKSRGFRKRRREGHA